MQINFSEVLKAKKFIGPFNLRTPLRFYPLLSDKFGSEVFVKHENFNLTGAFKVRGAIYFIGTMTDELKKKGVVAVTRGNHGLGLAVAGKHFKVPVTIIVPQINVSAKNELIKAYDAELIEYGKDYDEAREYCEQYISKSGKVYVHTANEPKIVAGAGTCTLEIFEDQTEPDYIILPIGGGGLITGSVLVRNAMNPKTKIIGVQAENANAMYLSWKAGKIINIGSSNTIADGVATKTAFELPFSFIKDGVAEIITISEDEIMQAIYDALYYTHSLIEGATALTLAALKKLNTKLRGKKTVLVFTGSNIDTQLLFQHKKNIKK